MENQYSLGSLYLELELKNASSYSGGTQLLGRSQLTLGNAAAAGSGAVSLGADALLDMKFSGEFQNQITGDGRVYANPDNTLTLTNTGNTYTGGTEVGYRSTLALTDVNAAGSGKVQMNGNSATLRLEADGGFSNEITGNGKVAVAPGTDNTLTLTNTGNTYAGGTTVETGTLELPQPKAAGTGDVQVESGATLRLAGGGDFAGALTGNAGSTLDVQAAGISAPKVQGFKTINFTLPGVVAAGDAVFTVTDPVDLTGVNITVGSSGSIPGIVTLISSVNGTLTPPTVPAGYEAVVDNGALVLKALYNVKGNSAAGGSVVCPTTLVPHGSGTTCKLTIREGYTFTKATYEGDANVLYNPDKEEFEVSDVKGAVTITASFALNEYSVQGNSAAGGSVVCQPAKVPHGSGTTCKLTISDGYTFTRATHVGNANVICDENKKECEVSAVKSAVTITANFTLNEYSVQGNTSAGGSVVCQPAKVPHGSGTTCKLKISDGYTFTKATYEGDAEVIYNPDKEEFEVSDVKGAVTITASFAQNEYSVQPATSIENGNISDCTPATINHGETLNVTCTATPDEGYKFTSLTLSDGKTDTTCEDTTCSFKNVQGNVTVSATFSKISISPAVVRINDNSNNKERLLPGKANTVVFTLGVDSFNGSGTLEITGVTKSQALQKAYFDDDKNKKSIDVRIENGGFTAVITPEKGEKTIEVTLTVAGGSYPFSFKVASAGTAAPVPTVSDIGLLLSGLVLAGAAAPALRRRERKERKQ